MADKVAEKTKDGESDTVYVEEIVRQTAIQSALLAGFAFTGLTAVTYDPSSSWRLQVAFATVASLAVALELIAVFTCGMLSFVAKMVPLDGNSFDREFTIAWLAYLVGLLAFVAALTLLAWVKIRPAAIAITIIAVLTCLTMSYIYYRIFKQSEFHFRRSA